MRGLIAVLVMISGCVSQSRLAETPTATTRRAPAEAPAASSSDEDREQLVRSNQDMVDMQSAHREVRQTGREARARYEQQPPIVPPVPPEPVAPTSAP